MKKVVDKRDKDPYNGVKGNKNEKERGEINMAKNAYVEETKKDAEEIIKLLEKVPKERKGEVLGIVKGYALATETEEKAG